MHTKWNERYSGEHYVYGTEPNRFLSSVAHLLKPRSNVLCLAEGEGRNSVFLAKQGHHVSAFDISTTGREKAQRLAKENNVFVQYEICDVNDYQFGYEKWDAIISIFAHTSSDIRDKVLPKIAKALKGGGFFILEAFHPNQVEHKYNTGGPKDVDWLVSLEELCDFFVGFEIIHAKEIERAVTEGLFHSGKAYVTQFVCRKF
ncbi:MAG: class I SAM-dependent methyltransferase [Gammaproteobacteria bacterium]|nr:class I SAM-dependent methyltransferase [Gammaproteobacteria bacterium]